MFPLKRMARMEPQPRENAMGTPIKRKIRNSINDVKSILDPPYSAAGIW
jgi:hypothetical protein